MLNITDFNFQHFFFSAMTDGGITQEMIQAAVTIFSTLFFYCTEVCPSLRYIFVMPRKQILMSTCRQEPLLMNVPV